MSDSAEDVRSTLDRRLTRLDHTVAEAAQLRRRGVLTRRSANVVLESSFSSAYAAFESFLEDLFFSVVTGHSDIQGAAGVVTFSNRALAERVLVASGDYLKWLPWSDGAKKVASRYLVDGVPFDRLSRAQEERSALEEARLLRNAVAHTSGRAIKDVRTLIEQMPPRERTVAGYLASTDQGVTQYAAHMSNFRAVSSALVESTEAQAAGHLLPPAPYGKGDAAPAGTYVCATCRFRHRSRRKSSVLPECSQCRARSGRQVIKWQRVW